MSGVNNIYLHPLPENLGTDSDNERLDPLEEACAKAQLLSPPNLNGMKDEEYTPLKYFSHVDYH